VSFLAPIWLLGLLPWAGVAAWLMWGRRRRVDVPFLALWGGIEPQRRMRRSVELPPAGVLFVLAAALLGVVAAARPVVGRSGGGAVVTIVVDRGGTMTADGGERYRRLIETGGREVAAALGPGPVQLVFVPGGAAQRSDRAGWSEVAKRHAAVALATGDELRQAVKRLGATSSGPIVVLSDQSINAGEGRVVEISPGDRIENVGITRVAARDGPAEVMVGVGNWSSATRATLTVSSGGRQRPQDVELPPPGGVRNYFVQMDGLADVVGVAVAAEGDRVSVDDQGWLVREYSWPRLEVRAELPAELRRMVEVYQVRRPAGERSKVVALVDREDQLAGGAGVVVSRDASGSAAGGELRVVDHPVTRSVRWEQATSGARVAERPRGDWTPLVFRGGRVLVAVRPEPARRVWVGFGSEVFARTADYVVFWTNVFDWVGEGGAEFTAHEVRGLPPEWTLGGGGLPAGVENGLWPGVYRRTDGALRAVNTEAVVPVEAPQTPWRERLWQLGAKSHAGRDLGPAAALAAMALMAGAAATWDRGNRRSNVFAVAGGPVAEARGRRSARATKPGVS